ncbi:hypothetical protein BGZ60DRAFT_41733 [Tricladium varicosporioides]|nr:hypothetical protein BGZ60DRAFT_41733 [Hymenoscyphus varicosporioides]
MVSVTSTTVILNSLSFRVCFAQADSTFFPHHTFSSRQIFCSCLYLDGEDHCSNKNENKDNGDDYVSKMFSRIAWIIRIGYGTVWLLNCHIVGLWCLNLLLKCCCCSVVLSL